jgi:hypothetical protein
MGEVEGFEYEGEGGNESDDGEDVSIHDMSDRVSIL